MNGKKPRVLCVDDEPSVLSGLARILRRDFEVVTAEGGAKGLAQLDGESEFAVVTSDLRMPEMDGIAFLSAFRERAPDTTRILLTGNADLSAAVAAVNEGNIFRLLSKPCEAEKLRAVIEAAAEQYRLVTSERVLLRQTLQGSVKMLTEAMALANPTAFGTAAPVQRRAGDAANALGSPDRWVMEFAAMLTQVARITLPPETLDKYVAGEPLTEDEQAMVKKLPEVGESLVVDIPRLDEVREIVRHQNTDFSVAADRIPMGARILRASLDLEMLLERGLALEDASTALANRVGSYDPVVLDVLTAEHSANYETLEVDVDHLRPGMVLLSPVLALNGQLLVVQGQEASIGMIERLQNFAKGHGVHEPILVKRLTGEAEMALTGTGS